MIISSAVTLEGRTLLTTLACAYASAYINYGRVAAQNLKAKYSLPANLCRLALQLEATARNEKKGHIRIIEGA